ncbi:MAG: hypothetical protein ACRD4L_01590 [Pyrinomonadaceae bacterium]
MNKQKEEKFSIFIRLSSMAVFLVLFFGSVDSLFSQDNGMRKAEDLMAQARKAVSGNKRLGSVNGLIVVGKYQRVQNSYDNSGEINVSIQLPDKFMLKRVFDFNAPGNVVTTTHVTALNGDMAWMDAYASGGATSLKKVDPSNGEEYKKFKKVLADQYTMYMLELLLTSPAPFPVQYTFVGEAEIPDGRADVIDVKGSEGFALRIFLNKETHLPLMYSYKTLKPTITRVTIATDSSGKSKANSLPTPNFPERKEEYIDLNIQVFDYKSVNGIMLPHRFLTKPVDGSYTEELNVTKYQINPEFKADYFVKKNKN